MGENLYYIMIFRDKNQSNFLSYLNRQTMNPGQCEEQRLKWPGIWFSPQKLKYKLAILMIHITSY